MLVKQLIFNYIAVITIIFMPVSQFITSPETDESNLAVCTAGPELAVHTTDPHPNAKPNPNPNYVHVHVAFSYGRSYYPSLGTDNNIITVPYP